MSRSFAECVLGCSNTPGFVEAFNRLSGHQLSPLSAPESPDAQAFADFVYRYVWVPTCSQILAQAITAEFESHDPIDHARAMAALRELFAGQELPLVTDVSTGEPCVDEPLLRQRLEQRFLAEWEGVLLADGPSAGSWNSERPR
jgi:hypothetical protein